MLAHGHKSHFHLSPKAALMPARRKPGLVSVGKIRFPRMPAGCGPQSFWQNPQDTAQRASCQALGGVRSTFNFVISSAAWQTCFAQHGPKATGHSLRNALHSGSAVRQMFAAPAVLESTWLCFEVGLGYFKGTAEVPSLPLAKSHRPSCF